VSGDRVYDMALRLRYSQMECNNGTLQLIVSRFYPAITALSQTPAGETLHILPTYSAMLEVRQVLTGRKICNFHYFLNKKYQQATVCPQLNICHRFKDGLLSRLCWLGRNLSLSKDYELLPELRGVRVRGQGSDTPGRKAGDLIRDVLCLGTNFFFCTDESGARESLGNALGSWEAALFP